MFFVYLLVLLRGKILQATTSSEVLDLDHLAVGWLVGGFLSRLSLESVSLTISGTVTNRYMVQLMKCPIDKTE